MVNATINSGVEIIKHQTYIVEDEMTGEARKIITGNSDESIYENDEKKFMDCILSKNTIFISTSFSRVAIGRLIKIEVPVVKIGSGECYNYPLLRFISKHKNIKDN